MLRVRWLRMHRFANLRAYRTCEDLTLPYMGGGHNGPPYYLILNNSKTLVARSMKLFHFLEDPIWRFSAKFQGHKSICSKNIDVLMKVGTLKSANTIYIQYNSKNIESFIKWAVVMLITPNLVSRHKIGILFECVQKNSKIYCSYWFSIVLYCL